jgi:hypothetical protein
LVILYRRWREGSAESNREIERAPILEHCLLAGSQKEVHLPAAAVRKERLDKYFSCPCRCVFYLHLLFDGASMDLEFGRSGMDLLALELAQTHSHTKTPFIASNSTAGGRKKSASEKQQVCLIEYIDSILEHIPECKFVLSMDDDGPLAVHCWRCCLNYSWHRREASMRDFSTRNNIYTPSTSSNCRQRRELDRVERRGIFLRMRG